MDGQEPIIGQAEHDHLQKIAGPVRADRQDLGWVSIRIEVHNDQRMVDGVTNVLIIEAVPSGRPMDIHTPIT